MRVRSARGTPSRRAEKPMLTIRSVRDLAPTSRSNVLRRGGPAPAETSGARRRRGPPDALAGALCGAALGALPGRSTRGSRSSFSSAIASASSRSISGGAVAAEAATSGRRIRMRLGCFDRRNPSRKRKLVIAASPAAPELRNHAQWSPTKPMTDSTTLAARRIPVTASTVRPPSLRQGPTVPHRPSAGPG